MTVRIALDLDNTKEDKAGAIALLGGGAAAKPTLPEPQKGKPLDRLAFSILDTIDEDLATIPGFGPGTIAKVKKWAGARLHGPSEEDKELEELAEKTRQEDAAEKPEPDDPGQTSLLDQIEEDAEGAAAEKVHQCLECDADIRLDRDDHFATDDGDYLCDACFQKQRQKEEPPAEEEPEAPVEVTRSSIADKLTELTKVADKDKALAVLHEFAPKLAEVDESDYGRLHSRLQLQIDLATGGEAPF